jgi:ABC-2 type transport system ATP-binding protein
MAAIQISGLDVVRGGRPVLRGIDLTVGDSIVTGLLGPSGSGKTTMMRCIVGLQRYEGSVRVLGREAGEPSLRHEIGYMTQSPSVYPDLSAGANVGYHAALHGRPRGAAREALGMVGLADRGGQLVGTMSGGERSRVSLACALVAQPRILVLDEPTVGLDPVLRRDLWQLFRSMSAERGVTLLVSSHVMDEARRCDELVLLREGRLLAHDGPQRLLARTGAPEMEEAFLRLIETTPEVSR